MKKGNTLDLGSTWDLFSHQRLSEFNKLVYPVVSRRSGGLSIGINLNPDRNCNFRCVYCQVDRALPVPTVTLSITQIEKELGNWFNVLSSNSWTYQNHLLKDISIAGDGEPTCIKELPEVLRLVAGLKARYGFESYKLVLFTNGSKIDRSDLTESLTLFFQQGGEIWFKLDFWNQESLQSINRTRLSSEQLVENLIAMGNRHPLVIQSCLFRWGKEEYDAQKYQPYVNLLRYILSKGTQIKLLQLYTLARIPENEKAQPWSNEEMDQLGSFIDSQVDIKTEIYYGQGKPE